MALKKCKECNKDVSVKAKTCPNCGVPAPAKEHSAGKALLIGVLIILVFGYLGRDSKEISMGASKDILLTLSMPHKSKDNWPKLNIPIQNRKSATSNTSLNSISLKLLFDNPFKLRKSLMHANLGGFTWKKSTLGDGYWGSFIEEVGPYQLNVSLPNAYAFYIDGKNSESFDRFTIQINCHANNKRTMKKMIEILSTATMVTFSAADLDCPDEIIKYIERLSPNVFGHRDASTVFKFKDGEVTIEYKKRSESMDSYLVTFQN